MTKEEQKEKYREIKSKIIAKYSAFGSKLLKDITDTFPELKGRMLDAGDQFIHNGLYLTQEIADGEVSLYAANMDFAKERGMKLLRLLTQARLEINEQLKREGITNADDLK